MTRKLTLLKFVPALVLGVFLAVIAFPGEALAASYTWKLETEFKTSLGTGHSQNRLTTNDARQVLWTFGTQVEYGKLTWQESADSYTLAHLQTNGLPFIVKVNGSTHQPNNYAAISYVKATWEQNMRGINGNIDARTGIIVRAYGAGGNVVATFYDNFTGSTQRPTWGVGYKNVQNHTFSLDLISSGTGNASVLYKNGDRYNGEWTNQNLIMRTTDMKGTNLVNLHSTNYDVPSTSTWAHVPSIDQDITHESWPSGDLYFVRIQDTIYGKLTDRIGITNVRIDKTNPVPSASFDDKTGTFKNQSTDALSGVKITEVKIDKLINDWTNIDDVTVTIPGEHVVTIRTTDNAGNVAQTQIKIKVPEKSTEPETKPEVKPETKPETNPDTGNLGDGFSLLMSN